MGVRLVAIVVVILVSALSGCTSDLYVNKSYRYQQSNPPKLAIVPLKAKVIDGLFSEVFGTMSRGERVVLPDSVRNKIESSPWLRDTLLRKLAKLNSGQTLKEYSNLKSIVSETHLHHLREELEDANLLLVPVNFQLDDMPLIGSTQGRTKFRLYDLHTGSLVYENSTNLRVNLRGEDGVQLMSAVLISNAREDFDKHFILNR